jgi:hypothetical protein
MSDETEPDEDALAEREARQERIQARAAIPALFLDTWGFSTWRGHIRITLGEELGGQDYYRTAFVMDLDNAEAFALQLFKSVSRRKKRDAAATKTLESIEVPDSNPPEAASET